MTAAVLPGPYRRVLAASTLSNLSDGIRFAAFPLLAASLTLSPLLIGLVAAAGLLPGPLLGLWAGWLSDRFDRQILAQATNTLRSALLLVLAAFIVTDQATIPLIMAAAFILGASEVLADNAMGTLVPSLVPSNQLEQANSRMVASEIMGNEFVGPMLGGLLFSAGMAVPFFSNAGLLAGSVLLLAGLPLLRPVEGDARATTDPARDRDTDPVAGSVIDRTDSGRIRDGVSYLHRSQPLRTITVASAALIAIDGAWFALLIVLSKVTLGLPDFAFGLLLAGGALGGLAGAAIADRFPHLTLRQVTVGVFATMAFSLLGLGLYPSVTGTVLALITTSGAFALWNVFVGSARQRLTPNHLLGRVTGAYKTIVLTAAFAGTLAGGLIAQVSDIEVSLITAGSLAALATPILWFTIRPASDANRG